MRLLVLCLCLTAFALGVVADDDTKDLLALPKDVKAAEEALDAARTNAIVAKSLYDDSHVAKTRVGSKAVTVDKEAYYAKFAVSVAQKDLAALTKRVDDNKLAVEDLKTEIATISKEVDNLKAQAPNWENQKTQLSKHLVQLESLNDPAAQAKLIPPTKELLQQIEANRQRLAQRSDDLLAKNEELKQIIAESDGLTKNDIPAAQTKLKNAEDELNRVLDRKEAVVKQDTETGVSHTGQAAKFAQAKAALRNAVQALKAALRKHIVQRKKAAEALATQRADAESALQDKKQKVAELAKSIKETQETLERYEAKLEELTNNHSAASKAVTKVANKHSAISSQHEDAKIRLEAVIRRYEKLKIDIAHFRKLHSMSPSASAHRFAASETSEMAEQPEEQQEESEAIQLEQEDEDEAAFLEMDDDAVFLEEEEDQAESADEDDDSENSAFVQEDDESTDAENEASEESDDA